MLHTRYLLPVLALAAAGLCHAASASDHSDRASPVRSYQVDAGDREFTVAVQRSDTIDSASKRLFVNTSLEVVTLSTLDYAYQRRVKPQTSIVLDTDDESQFLLGLSRNGAAQEFPIEIGPGEVVHFSGSSEE